MLNTACFLVCSIHLWRIYGGPDHQYRMAWLTCFSIMPTYIVLYMTQITPLVLLGVVAFLDFHERKQHWLSGVALVLVAIKPHLVFIFWAALIAWILKNRRWH